jgi:hypothetical protein
MEELTSGISIHAKLSQTNKCNSLERQYFALELSIEMHLTLEPLTKYSWGCLLRFLLERVSKYWPHQYKHKQYNNFDFAVKV